jgi:hypothetical protein
MKGRFLDDFRAGTQGVMRVRIDHSAIAENNIVPEPDTSCIVNGRAPGKKDAIAHLNPAIGSVCSMYPYIVFNDWLRAHLKQFPVCP